MTRYRLHHQTDWWAALIGLLPAVGIVVSCSPALRYRHRVILVIPSILQISLLVPRTRCKSRRSVDLILPEVFLVSC